MLQAPEPRVADTLASLRREASLKQADVAERAECSLAMVGLLEGGWLPKRRSSVLPRIEAALVNALRERFDKDDEAPGQAPRRTSAAAGDGRFVCEE